VTSVSSVPAEISADDQRTGVSGQCLLVQEEIWRVVSEAGQAQTSLPLSQEARRIANAFPASGYSLKDIEDALVFAAVDEGVMLEIRPAAREVPFIEVRSLLRAAGRLRGRRSGRGVKKPPAAEAALQAAPA
jgi:hypothetical protein